MSARTSTSLVFVIALIMILAPAAVQAKGPIKVVATYSDFASIVKEIGGDRVNVSYLSQGDQDPHFVAPKPSLALKLRKADMFVLTGMDLEVWASTLLDKARNKKIMDGGIGYVTVYTNLDILEKPVGAITRTEGDIHVAGNPHFHTSPVNWITISENILIGLKKVDPGNAAYYEERQEAFVDKVYRRLYGDELVGLIGGQRLTDLLENGTLFEFLDKEYQGEKLITRLGVWMKKALPFRGEKVIAYHKNWSYFARDFGLEIVGYIEPKPGIPPTPKHVQFCVNLIRENNIAVMLVANYFEKRKPMTIAQKTGIKALFLPFSVNSISEVPDNFALVDYWIDSIDSAIAAAPGSNTSSSGR